MGVTPLSICTVEPQKGYVGIQHVFLQRCGSCVVLLRAGQEYIKEEMDNAALICFFFSSNVWFLWKGYLTTMAARNNVEFLKV